MADRRYIPEIYVDELCPPGRGSPSAWIGAPAGDVWLLATEPDIDLGVTLKPGQVVPFAWIEPLGNVLVHICADGSHAVEGTLPAGVTHFWFGSDILADSLDDFVREWRAFVGSTGESEGVLVDMSRWSREAEPYRFEIAEGGPRFVAIAAEGVAP